MAASAMPTPIEDRLDSSLLDPLRANGIEAVVVASEADLDAINGDDIPSLAFVDVASMARGELGDCVRRCSRLKLPAIALVPEQRAADLDPSLEVADFVLLPARSDELLARAIRVLNRTASLSGKDHVRSRGLVINRANYEVSVNGRPVNLRFKEYELLLLMAANPGRVYSRETLLSQIWGYDYLGGTRTVDVHIRRLRSKIEDAEAQFIETVWNVGYRFRHPDRS